MHIPIKLNIDGLPIFKSSLSSIWSVLVNIKSIVFPICLTYGKKPIELNFINSTIENLHTLLHNGILFNTYKITFYIKNIVCDAPAKSFMKGVKQFNVKEGCDKCTAESKHIDRSPCYLQTEYTLRTDDEFHRNMYINHQRVHSPFTNLNIDMIKCFNIDYMHCVLLGVTTKLLKMYMNSDKAIHT